MDDRTKEDALAAIAVVTAALGEQDRQKTLAAQVASDWTSEHPDGHSRLTNGFLQLCILLLADLKLETGTEPEKALQTAAEVISLWGQDD